MNLRLSEDALRVRLSVEDVAQLRAAGVLDARVAFPGGEALTVVLGFGAASARLAGARVELAVPRADFDVLAAAPTSRRDGLEYHLGALTLAVEVDVHSARAAKK